MSCLRGIDFEDDFMVQSDIYSSDEQSDDCSDEDSSDDVPLVIPYAVKALAYFNSKYQTDFELLVDEPTDFGVFLTPTPIFHINFFAHSPSSPSSTLFYAELQSTSFVPRSKTEITVFGCSMLRLVDSGNPLGLGCGFCDSDSLIHPGPLRGYGVQLGDLFSNSPFWKYAPSLFESQFYDVVFALKKKFYTACAEKAVQHLNSKAMAAMHEPFIQVSPQSKSADFSHVTLEDATLKSICNWKLVELVAAVDNGGDPIHVNLKVESSEVSSPMLCFAELFVPEKYAYGGWKTEKEHLLEIRGCCIMKQLESDTQFGRVCGVCRDHVIHPGPAYDYCSVVGDEFDGSDFKRVGCGVF